jgi:hypothetical protein
MKPPGFTIAGAYREMAESGMQFHGLSILQHADGIGAFIREVGATSMLDWGCGGAEPYDSPRKLWYQWGFERKDVTLYDPSFKKFSALPAHKADIVICSDVLEHIMPGEVNAFINNLFARANKAVWASVCCREAKKTFPNSTINLHVCIRPYAWWHDRFTRLAPPGVQWRLVESP